MKEISTEINRLHERLADADQVIEDSKSRIEEEQQEYVDLSLEAKEYDPEQVEKKRLEIRTKIEKKIVRNIEKRTGIKIRELDLAISKADTDKSLRSLVHTRKQKTMEKEKRETKMLRKDPENTKKKKAADNMQKQS